MKVSLSVTVTDLYGTKTYSSFNLISDSDMDDEHHPLHHVERYLLSMI